jgi:hypothetical protein
MGAGGYCGQLAYGWFIREYGFVGGYGAIGLGFWGLLVGCWTIRFAKRALWALVPGEPVRHDPSLDPISAPPEPFPIEDDTSSPSGCLSCGAAIPSGTDRCPQCGWSYRPSP